MAIDPIIFSILIGSETQQGSYRLIRKNELPFLLDLYAHLHQSDKKPSDSTVFSNTWESICSNPNIYYFVAELSGKLIGSCHLVIVPNLTRACKPYGVIENVVTHLDYRSKGIGKGILKYALQTAWSMGCYKVMLMTGSQKEWVHAFYESAGFKKGAKTAFLAKP